MERELIERIEVTVASLIHHIKTLGELADTWPVYGKAIGKTDDEIKETLRVKADSLQSSLVAFWQMLDEIRSKGIMLRIADSQDHIGQSRAVARVCDGEWQRKAALRGIRKN